MLWKLPPKIKIYEALGCLADNRLTLDDDQCGAQVESSNRNKVYTVRYDAPRGAIISNDNSSYWRGHLGYPAITYLMKIGVIDYDHELPTLLKGIKWKELNTKFRNDFEKTRNYILENYIASDDQRLRLERGAETVLRQLAQLQLSRLGSRVEPPQEVVPLFISPSRVT